ncbi:MAG: RtcB family protein [Candidatus Competibacteraceae bacterium]
MAIESISARRFTSPARALSSAREGELGIIPGSMGGAKSYIVRSKGDPESFCSCSHGAGRRMSREQAKRSFNVADIEKQTQGVECRKDASVIGEVPGAPTRTSTWLWPIRTIWSMWCTP